jgi:hypothetical protein
MESASVSLSFLNFLCIAASELTTSLALQFDIKNPLEKALLLASFNLWCVGRKGGEFSTIVKPLGKGHLEEFATEQEYENIMSVVIRCRLNQKP